LGGEKKRVKSVNMTLNTKRKVKSQRGEKQFGKKNTEER
jgi:hypothetical protein